MESKKMRSLLFATNNGHKIAEVQQILGARWQIRSLKDQGIEADLPETGMTLHDNAVEKASFIHSTFGVDCFAEDTGLEVAFLGGAPGVYTARYAGVSATPDENMSKLLEALGDTKHRRAQFHTVIAMWLDKKLITFEGHVYGSIAYKLEGEGGFGYDPIFIPQGYDHSFAQLPPYIKQQISHRARAVAKLSDFIADL
ncbi:MAG: RdgB/HAM1 family non-canonical purine NTP pyrophosphatase [Saprospiraceae bacterium]|nr:RdgB/HAM1 family non-canonical purine NTP pyrophosphatase [Saprospiraceae bacterium]